MYLFLVDKYFTSSSDFQELFGQSNSENDIVNCLSVKTLLTVAEKIKPQTIIVDFSLISSDRVRFFAALREKNQDSNILALVEPDNHAELFAVIEHGGIDDYIVKPIRKEDFRTRIRIASKRAGMTGGEDRLEFKDSEITSIKPSLDYGNLFDFPDEPFSEVLLKESSDPDSDTSKDSIKLFEDMITGITETDSKWNVSTDDIFETEMKPGPAVVKPAEEFLEKAIPGEEKVFIPEPQDRDNQFFSELNRRSELPGESADDFLYGLSDRKNESHYKSPRSEYSIDRAEDFHYSGRNSKKKVNGSGFKNFVSILGNFVFALLLVMMVALSFFLIQSNISGGAPQIAGYQIYIVLSGSMSPEFDEGSLALVREVEPEQLVIGDVITFRSQAESESLTTHRIVEVNLDDGLKFITRGDANLANDPNPVLADNVVGRVTGSVPYIGYLMNFVQTRQGLILLIFIPGILIIVYELSKIFKYLTQGNNGKKLRRHSKYSKLAEYQD